MSIDMILALVCVAPLLILMWAGKKSTRSSRMFVVVTLLGVMALSMVTSGCSSVPTQVQQEREYCAYQLTQCEPGTVEYKAWLLMLEHR